uniref:7-cyano-7-deazaguanine synthase n=1 Tax=Candidatus Kentrum sp. FM TaxID=2126340 RepID=A0A450RW03_9GAMM|nr:MAG: 7-cyano-7-deazaguanine synthase (queuosine biosynthesis) [Candidatus Kentron sp. FM]VFJ43948.1 MAG: 7-cyano-7-deazaguanine synthase (queuosine biosynthesis) [Candidatus Kentron sp. FM]VFK06036.1 MAG: 7-cyano-7-deazaguanine synthase (queuosine biosynthesis) [Candidatus Kentron sp. FM]
MRVVCSPNPAPLSPNEGVAFSLFRGPQNKGVGHLAGGLPDEVRKAGIEPSERSWDFLVIALSVVAADFGCKRENSPDGWTREISLEVSVLDPDFWSTRGTDLEEALAYLSGDIWRLEFRPGGASPPVLTSRRERKTEGDCACLLSGGADSLVGAIDAVAEGKTPVLVSRRAGDSDRQKRFARSLGRFQSHLQLHSAKPPGENSQRARSILFLAYGLVAAMHLSEKDSGNRKTLLVPENGFISLNVPLTPLRAGSLSTRTTHPYFIRKIQAIFDACGFPVEIENPYQFKTKGEMFAECKNPELLRKLASQSMSCSRSTRLHQHCGRCVPCLIRRAAFVRAGIYDETSYHYSNLSINDAAHLHFDDVQAARYAIHSVATKGVGRWAGSAISIAQLGEREPYLSVAERGIRELKTLFQGMGIQ